MTDADSVRSLDEVAAEWLTERLRAAGHTDAEIIGLRHQPVGTGQMGNSVRFTLEHSRTREVPRRPSWGSSRLRIH